MTTIATGGFGQPGLVERRHLDQLHQFDSLHQQLGDAIAAVHHDRLGRVQVDQRNLDLAAIARVDRTRTVDDRKSNSRSQSRPWMHQADHAERDGDRDPRSHQGASPGFQFDVFRAVEIDAGVAFVGAAGQRKIGVKADDGQTGRHGATDYP